MLCERESAKVFWKISFQPLKIPLKDKKMGIFGCLWRRHLWCQNSNSNLYVGISNKLLPTIWKFLPTKSVWCKTGLLTGLVKNTPAGYFLLQPTKFLAHFFCPPRLQVVLDTSYQSSKADKLMSTHHCLSPKSVLPITIQLKVRDPCTYYYPIKMLGIW